MELGENIYSVNGKKTSVRNIADAV